MSVLDRQWLTDVTRFVWSNIEGIEPAPYYIGHGRRLARLDCVPPGSSLRDAECCGGGAAHPLDRTSSIEAAKVKAANPQ